MQKWCLIPTMFLMIAKTANTSFPGMVEQLSVHPNIWWLDGDETYEWKPDTLIAIETWYFYWLGAVESLGWFCCGCSNFAQALHGLSYQDSWNKISLIRLGTDYWTIKALCLGELKSWGLIQTRLLQVRPISKDMRALHFSGPGLQNSVPWYSMLYWDVIYSQQYIEI